MKCNILLNYITDLSLVLLEKAEGNTLEKNETVQRLVENRIVSELMPFLSGRFANKGFLSLLTISLKIPSLCLSLNLLMLLLKKQQ